MSGRKDLMKKNPFVSMPTKLEEEMFHQISAYGKQFRTIKKILEECK